MDPSRSYFAFVTIRINSLGIKITEIILSLLNTNLPTVAVISDPVGPLHRISGGGDRSSVMSSMIQVNIIPAPTFFTCLPPGLMETVCASGRKTDTCFNCNVLPGCSFCHTEETRYGNFCKRSMYKGRNWS